MCVCVYIYIYIYTHALNVYTRFQKFRTTLIFEPQKMNTFIHTYIYIYNVNVYTNKHANIYTLYIHINTHYAEIY